MSNQNTLTGTWYNELNSTAIFTQDGNSLSGTYNTIVGNAKYWYNLTGFTNLPDSSNPNQAAVGFTVVWYNPQYGDSKSVTAWSCQYQVVNNQESIICPWLLTTETDPDNNWSSTNVGQDVFTRTMPTTEDIEYSLAHGAKHSHPDLSGEVNYIADEAN
jgi:hypothetical protein